MTAVKDLIYSGTCNLNEVALAFQNLFSTAVAVKIIYPQLNLPEILETLAVLGIEVTGKSFGRSATQNLAQKRKGKKTAGKDFKIFRESA